MMALKHLGKYRIAFVINQKLILCLFIFFGCINHIEWDVINKFHQQQRSNSLQKSKANSKIGFTKKNG